MKWELCTFPGCTWSVCCIIEGSSQVDTGQRTSGATAGLAMIATIMIAEWPDKTVSRHLHRVSTQSYLTANISNHWTLRLRCVVCFSYLCCCYTGEGLLQCTHHWSLGVRLSGANPSALTVQIRVSFRCVKTGWWWTLCSQQCTWVGKQIGLSGYTTISELLVVYAQLNIFPVLFKEGMVKWFISQKLLHFLVLPLWNSEVTPHAEVTLLLQRWQHKQIIKHDNNCYINKTTLYYVTVGAEYWGDLSIEV